MTKNNLTTHLKWLLKQGPSLYPSLTLSAHENRNNANDQNPPHARPILEQPTVDFELGKEGHPDSIAGTFVKGTGADDADVKVDDTNMARLLLAPQSANKPRLLSSPKEPVEGNKAGNSGAHEKSPSEQRKTRNPNVVIDTQCDLPPPPHSIKEPATTPRRPKHAFDVDSPMVDVDAIDLTGEPELAAAPSSETLEEFGSPHRLWTEDAAFRTGPEKRGKKRKSDEYKSDLLSPRRHVPKARSPLASNNSAAFKEPALAQKQPVSSNSHLARQPERQSSVHCRDRSENRVIADSDDDENDLFDRWVQDNDPIVDHDEALYPVLPKEDRLNGHKADGSPKRPKTMPSLVKEKSLAGNASSPTKKASPQKQQESPPIPFPFPSSSQPKPDETVSKILALSDGALCRIITEFKNTLTKNSEIVYQQAMEGVPALDLIAVNRTLKDQTEAIEQLKKEKRAYKICESKKNNLKKALMQVILQGDDPSSMSELAESRVVSAELGQIGETIRGLLSRANILHMIPDSSVRATASSPTRLPQADNPSQLRTLSPTTKAVPEPTMDDVSGLFDYDEPMSGDEDVFTRNMGSPAPPVSVREADEFGLDADEEDMLEVAGHFEGKQFPTESGYESRSRTVFGEMSGNARRTPCAETSGSDLRILSPEKSPIRTALWNQHLWSMDVKNALKDRFHLRGFRMNQLEAIDATLGGKDTFVLMPTGGGKSLCYQLPSVVSSGSTRGVTIVISPLLSLMQDQVEHLQRLQIKAHLLNGGTQKEERQWMMSTLSGSRAEEHIQLLYITPEMINKSQVLTRTLERLHSRQRLARIVIDEAHCVSQWGHDFRPDYKELGEIRNLLPGVPMMALTATATENVKVDVIHNLKMQGCQVFTQSFNRPNLTYEVRPKTKGADLLSSIANVIKTYRNQSGIVYCLSRKTCEKVAKALSDQYSIKAAFYHAGMETSEKTEVQQNWQSGRYTVIVATIAFGMGIDKSDVRFVIHHSIPKSLEGYYQETGRAGRDGKRSGCYLYYAYKDTSTINRMIDSGEGSKEQKERQHQMLRNVVQYCENKSDCRRVQILAYFNEYFRREHCNASCDNCKSDSVFETQDFTEYAASAIKLVRHFQNVLDEKVTLSYCVNIFRGSVKKFRSPEHRKIPWHGDGSALQLGEAERLFQRLLSEGALREENVVNSKRFATQYVKIGRRAAEFETGRRELKLQVRLSPRKNTSRSNSGNNDDHPQSTNVSSPVQSANQRRLARFQHRAGDSDDDDSESADSDGFEKIRVAGKSRQERKRLLGPPITEDGDFSRLDPLHQTIAEDFMYYAKQYCQSIMLERNLRSQPFTDGVLRQIAVQFPKNLRELATVPGIDADKVSRYGTQILKLVRDTERRLAELKQEGDDANGVIPDPNHTNVINVSDDDNDGKDDNVGRSGNADSDEEFGGNDIFTGQPPSLFDVDDNSVVSSRFFSRQSTQSTKKYHDAVLENSGSKSRRTQTNKRPRKAPSTSGPKTRGSRTKTAKPGDNAGTGHTGPSNRSTSFRKTSSKAKLSTARIPMMPV